MVFLLCSVLLLGVGVPAFFLTSNLGAVSTNVLLTYGVALWAVLRLVLTASTGARRLTLMCFYIFVYVFFGIQPMVSAWTGQFPHRPYLTEGEMLRTIGFVVLGIAAFELAYAARRSRRMLLPADAGTPVAPPVSLALLWIGFAGGTALALVAAGVYGPNIFLGIRGGVTIIAGETRAMSQTEGLLVISGIRGLVATLLFITVYLWSRRASHAWTRTEAAQLRVLLGLQLIVNLLVSNPLSSARLWSGSVILTVLFVWARWKGAWTYLLWASGACVALLGLFSAIDPRVIIAAPLLRGEELGPATIMRAMQQSLQTLQLDGNFDAFQMLGLISGYADRVGYALGYQLLLPLLFWVPRAVWPGKPLGTPDVVAESLNFFSLNVGSPLWAEGYINFGVLGVVLLLGAFGVGARIADDVLTRTVRHPGDLFPTIASSFFAANTIILLRGDLTTGTMYLQMVLGFTYAIILFMKRRARITPAPLATPT